MKRFLPVASLLLAVACGSPGTPGVDPAPRVARPKRSTAYATITREEIDARAWSNVYELVSTLRPLWIRVRGADNLNDMSTKVQAYLDTTHLPDAQSLENLAVAGIHSVEFVDGIAASSRWGLGHGQGAIVVHTRAP